MILKINLTVLFACNLLSCATSQFIYDPNEPIRTVSISKELKIAELTENNQPRIRQPTESDKFDTQCRLASMPGYFYGYTQPPVFKRFEIKNHSVTLNLEPAGFNKHLRIAPLIKATPDFPHKLETIPAGVKFARLGTICDKIFVGLASPKPDPMLLFYFDQEVHIKGTIGAGDQEEIVDLRIPQKGFYYIITEPMEKQKKRINSFYTGKEAFLAVSTKRL